MPSTRTYSDKRRPAVDSVGVMTLEEVRRVLAYWKARKPSNRAMLRVIIFRLATCCGLRASEISLLNMEDVILSDRPAIYIRRSKTKSKEGRRVPLWWDAGTLEDMHRWYGLRIEMGATPACPFVCSLTEGRVGARLDRIALWRHFKWAIRPLGAERVKQISIHGGRHTFCTLALMAGRTLIQVRDAAGHQSVNTTSQYLHVLDDRALPDIFGPIP